MSIVGGQEKIYRRLYTNKDLTPWKHRYSDEILKDSDLPPCIFGVPVVDYLNDETVRSFLHIPVEV